MLRNVSVRTNLPPMDMATITRVRQVEALSRTREQIKIPVHHFIHAGMYARTVRIPAGVMITGALVKVETIIIIDGDCMIYIGAQKPANVKGYHVLKASAGRKQVFVARTDTMLTMLFPTDVKTVKDAEEQFTDEVNLLQSHEA